MNSIDIIHLSRTPEGRSAMVGGWVMGKRDVLFSYGDKEELSKRQTEAMIQILNVGQGPPFNVEAALSRLAIGAYTAAVRGLTLDQILKR